jgi:putative membrane-bound dehydrogenase-like protein
VASHRTPRRLRRFIVALFVMLGVTAQAAGPIRVLYLGKENTPSSHHCAALMQELGRDAIWFDYTSDPHQVTRDWLGKFDAVVLDAPAGEYKELGAQDANHIVNPEFGADEIAWLGADFIKAVREKLLAAAGGVRRAEWEGYLADREPEQREANPNVANYERRPEALTFQKPMNVKASMQRTQAPVDMHLELFASEPDIAKPIALAWDERGRLWVAETRDYPHGVNADGAGHDDIKICEDTDGDGHADKFTIFADKLNLPTSLTFANGGVIVAEPPRFLFLKDTNGDDQADVREVLLDGWGIKDTHAQASNLHWGYDNWIHGCVGYSGYEGMVGGKKVAFLMGTYRLRSDGQALEFLHQFTNNAWAQSQNAAGDDFGGTANNAPLFYGGIPNYVVPAGLKAMTAKKINVEDKAHAITPNYRQVDVFGGYTAAAGTAFIYSAKLPARLQGKAMVCEPTMKLISLMDVQPAGAGYIAKDAFNLVASSDEWMSPVFAEVGPDGAVWFADWQNFIIQHNPTPSAGRGGYDAKTGMGGAHENPLRDHARGRIYRVVWNEAAKPAQVLSLDRSNTGQLVAALGSDTQNRRLTAQRVLVETRKDGADRELQKVVAANDGNIAAIHALWALDGLGRLDETTLKAALFAKDSALRRNAVRALPADANGFRLLTSGGVLSDPDPITRLAALVKLAEFETTPEIKSLSAKLAVDPTLQADEWLKEAARVLVRKHKAITYQEGPNLLPNPGFELTGPDGLPQGWTRRDYGQAPATKNAEWRVLTEQTHRGQQAVRCITRGDGDTSLFADVPLKPHTRYRLSAWVKTHAFKGKASLNDHIGRAETERITDKEADWSEVETFFDSGDRTKASINLLHVAKGDSLFDDVKLCDVTGDTGEEKLLTADPKRGELVFYKHPAVACVLCHMVKGQGSTVGPALDGLATRAKPDYIRDSLLEPNKVLAKGFEHLGASPMPPMGLILKPQELEDVQAFLQTLK